MSEYGINSADLKIDSKYRSYVHKSTHKLSQECVNGELTTAMIDCEPTDVFVVCDLHHSDPLNLNRYNSVLMYYDDDLSNVGFDFCPENNGAKATITVHKFTLAHKSTDKYGFEVYDDQGRVVLNSSEKPLLVQDVVRLGEQSQVTKMYGHKVGLLAQQHFTIPIGNFGNYQELLPGLKVGSNNSASYMCFNTTEINGEYFGDSTPAKPINDTYPSMIIINLSNI